MKTIIANWKMYLGLSEQIALAKAVVRGVKGIKAPPEIILAPSSIALIDIVSATEKSRIKLAAQNMHSQDKGAFTGGISAQMIKEAGVSSVIIGHSERRRYAGETDETAHNKLQLALENGLDIIVCIGEDAKTRENGETEEYVSNQIDKIFKNAHLTKRSELYIAYEPIWAIGAGRTPLLPDVTKVKEKVEEKLKENGITEYKFLYGGSINPENIKEFIDNEQIDGALVGGASTKIKTLLEIIEKASNTTSK